MSIALEQCKEVLGKPVFAQDGRKIGKVEELFLDHHTHTPQWIVTQDGLFVHHPHFIPIGDATFEDEAVRVPFDRLTVKRAPHMGIDNGSLTSEQEDELYDYYGASCAPSGRSASSTDSAEQDGAQPHGRFRPTYGVSGHAD